MREVERSPARARAGVEQRATHAETKHFDGTRKGPTPDGEPLTVVIDGPSAFTFVREREGEWKFVGRIADKSP